MGKLPLLATIFSKIRKKVLRLTLHINPMLCFKKYALTSVTCKVIKNVTKWPI